jgi:transposase
VKTNSNAGLTVFWAGVDTAKESLKLALWGHFEFSEMETFDFPRQAKTMKHLLALLKERAPEGSPIGIVMEATGKYSEEVAAWLLKLDSSLRVAIINPFRIHEFVKSLGFRNKTDSLDAKALARFGRDRNPVSWAPPAPDLAELRDMVRIRADLVRTRTAMKNRLGDHERASKQAAEAMRKVIEALTTQVEALESAIKAHLKAHPDLGNQVKSHMSVSGVGIVTSTTVLAELGDLRRFDRSRQMTAFAGVSPRLRDSGKKIGKPHMCKEGSARVRAELYMAASNAIQHNPDMKAYYEHLLKRGKKERAALGAVMRKLLVIMRAILVAGAGWRPIRAA